MSLRHQHTHAGSINTQQIIIFQIISATAAEAANPPPHRMTSLPPGYTLQTAETPEDLKAFAQLAVDYSQWLGVDLRFQVRCVTLRGSSPPLAANQRHCLFSLYRTTVQQQQTNRHLRRSSPRCQAATAVPTAAYFSCTTSLLALASPGLRSGV